MSRIRQGKTNLVGEPKSPLFVKKGCQNITGIKSFFANVAERIQNAVASLVPQYNFALNIA
jgi:hypothetical protein